MILDDKELVKDLPRYLNNVNLKAAGASLPLSIDQFAEMEKIMRDPIYFIENYVRIISIDDGWIPFRLYPYQKRLINLVHNERKVIAKFPRQSGKTTTNAAYLLWYILVNEVKTVGVLAHKASGAREVLERTKQMYEGLPLWLQQGVVTWNKGSIELGNGCRVIAAATTSSAIRGFSISFLLLDEFAFIPSNNATEFFDSVYPTISSGKKSKISIFSTPKGMNHFYKMWKEATEGKVVGDTIVKSEFAPIEIEWNEIPGRGEVFKQKTIATIGQDSWDQEYACVVGNTLVEVKCVVTGEIFKMKIEELDSIYKEGMQTFEIKTKHGFEPFHGIQSLQSKTIKIKTDRGDIECTHNHRFKCESGMWVNAEFFEVGDYIQHESGLATIEDISDGSLCTVYDALEVNGNEFLTNGFVSHNCSFLGAVGSLISSTAIKKFPAWNPLVSHPFTKVYEEVKEGHIYMATVDVARGAGGDYSVCVITDITSLPYKQVAVYRNNELNYMLFPGVIYELAKHYNSAYVLIELNDNGETVADDLFYNYEYDNVLTTGGAKGKISLGAWTNAKNGMRTTKTTKRLGCAVLKALIENGEYEVRDYETLEEMANFVAKGGSYEADSGSTDDIMMCLVIFAWASNEPYFKELCNADFKKKYVEQSYESMLQDLSPIGYFDGYDDNDTLLLT